MEGACSANMVCARGTVCSCPLVALLHPTCLPGLSLFTMVRCCLMHTICLPTSAVVRVYCLYSLRTSATHERFCAAEDSSTNLYADFCRAGGVMDSCGADRVTQTFIECGTAVAMLYFVIICAMLVYKLRVFNGLPYDKIQAAIVFYRVQVLFLTHGCITTHA